QGSAAAGRWTGGMMCKEARLEHDAAGGARSRCEPVQAAKKERSHRSTNADALIAACDGRKAGRMWRAQRSGVRGGAW
ncbi:hypothetical protein ACFSSA_15825, partial [Luteolibacter algae]